MLLCLGVMLLWASCADYEIKRNSAAGRADGVRGPESGT